MNVLVFDVLGRYAHFRSFDTTRENMSFPFPPRTALLGLIGAIIGLERNSYWNESSSLGNAKIGVQLVKPVQRTTIKTNYLQSRSPVSIDGLKIMIPKDPFEVNSKDQRGFNMPISLNLLLDPCFRVFFTSEDQELFQDLETRLKKKKYVYPPYLGHANMLATLKFIAKCKGKLAPAGIYEVESLVPTTYFDVSVEGLDSLGYAILFNVPTRLKHDENANETYLKKTSNIVFPTTAGQKIKARFKENAVVSIQEPATSNEQYITFLEG